jgi:hypothetical protein
MLSKIKSTFSREMIHLIGERQRQLDKGETSFDLNGKMMVVDKPKNLPILYNKCKQLI